MVFNSFHRQNIYPQTGNLSFLQKLTVDNTTGVLECGFSGQLKCAFSLRSGKFLDHQGRFLDVYSDNRQITVSGNISPTAIDYYLNGQARAYEVSRQTGNFSCFFVDPRNCTVNFDLTIYGDKPLYSISNNIIYLASNPHIPIQIANHSPLPFRIFSGQMLTDPNSASVSGLPTGDITGVATFYILQDNISGRQVFNINLYTNFGTERLSIDAVGV